MLCFSLLLAQALVAQTPSSGAAGGLPLPAPAPLRAPVLLEAEVAFASTEAVRIEWETDLGAFGEVRYGTSAPLGYTVKAPVYSPSQSVTLDVTGFPPGVPLYFQIAWNDRMGLGGVSDLRPVAYAHSAPPPKKTPASPPATWLLFAGPAFRGSGLGWNAGVAHRPEGIPVEASVEGGGFRHKSSRIGRVDNVTLHDRQQSSDLSFGYLRARADYLHRIEHIRGPFGEPLFNFPGHLRAGAGVALYGVKSTVAETHPSQPLLDKETATSDARAVPFLEFGVARRVGLGVEVQVAGEYVFSRRSYGLDDRRFGGPAFLVQVAYRLK